jgi:hypothetical protein
VLCCLLSVLHVQGCACSKPTASHTAKDKRRRQAGQAATGGDRRRLGGLTQRQSRVALSWTTAATSVTATKSCQGSGGSQSAAPRSWKHLQAPLSLATLQREAWHHQSRLHLARPRQGDKERVASRIPTSALETDSWVVAGKECGGEPC